MISNRLQYDLAEEQLREGSAVMLRFEGRSMWPTLSARDKVVLEPLHGEPAVGDVLLFHHAGGRVVHRLVGRDGDRYVLQGDNNLGTERATRADLVARMTAVVRHNGHRTTVDSARWQRLSRWVLRRKRLKNSIRLALARDGRRRWRPWYFGALAFLMWAPLNGLGVPLDNYILGLRADHLLHASVYLPCALFLWDLFRRHRGSALGLTWLCAVAIGLLTEGVQYLIPWRGFDINDIIANTLGATLGWLALLIAKRLR